MIKNCILFSCICHLLIVFFGDILLQKNSNNNNNNNNNNNAKNNINIELVNVKSSNKNNLEIPELKLKDNTEKVAEVKPKNSEKDIKKNNKNIISKNKENSNKIKKEITKNNWQKQITKHFNKLKKRHLFYPLEAIQNNIQGVVEVRIFLDNNGNVIISRVENSSGYEILDNAALKAVKSIKGLEENAPREFILPVRFSLN